MELKITQERLERLRQASIKNEKGLANFILIENKDKRYGHFVFRVVCERVDNKVKTLPERTHDALKEKPEVYIEKAVNLSKGGKIQDLFKDDVKKDINEEVKDENL